VTDAGGLSHTATCDVVPRKATITVTSNPVGLTVTVDGTPRVTPYSFVGVAGLSRPLGLVSPQNLNGQTYTFASWSNGGAQNHAISTPAANTTYTASFSGGSGWLDADIGSVGQAGSSAVSGTSATVHGSGADIWGNADGFHFTYKPLEGDGTLTARVTGVQATDPWAKAGIMMRWDASPGSPHAFMALTSANGAAFQHRDAASGESFHVGVAGGAPAWVRLVRAGNKITGFHSADGVSWTYAGEINYGLPVTVLAGLAVTSHNNAALNASTFDNIAFAATPPSAPWTAQDIGNVGLGGRTTATHGRYISWWTVEGAGDDIYNAADAFHFYHRPLIGDGSITANVASISNTHEWAKAGVMIRESSAPGSRHVYVGTTPANGLEFLRREAEGGGTTPVAVAGGAPRWIRASRVGDVLTVYHSADGDAWTQMGQVTMALRSDILMGLAVTSHNPAALNTAVFTHVSFVE
jgi:regulation of enolase protein 1 (concanavalin A-like superfamily)